MRMALGFAATALCAMVYAEPIGLPGFKMPKPPVIDGVVNDREWAGVPSASGSFDYLNGNPGPEPMRIWLAYDEQFVYFAAKLTDHDRSKIRSYQYQSNVSLTGEDEVTLNIDLTGSLASFSSFSINPRGATSVALAGGRALKREWSGDFVAAGRITEDGWEVESRIPWQIMPLPASGIRDLRFNVDRYLPRVQRDFVLVYTNNDKISDTPIWRGVEVPKESHERRLLLLPYGYAGFDDHVRGHAVLNSGLDLKTQLTDNVNLVGTINPDFRNIENQILSLDFSRFARIAGETRPFFLEGADFYNSALFTSQVIGEVDAGANAYGQVSDKVTFGALDTISIHHQNDFVLNGTYTPTPTDSYRATVTNLSQAGLENTAYLARYSKQLGDYNLFLRSMGSYDSLAGSGQNEDLSIYSNKKGWVGSFEYQWVAPNFNPRLGFFPEVDYKGFDSLLAYDRLWNHGPFAEAEAGLSLTDWTHVSGAQYRQNADLSGTFALSNGLSGGFDEFVEDFEGEHDHTTMLSLTYPRDNLFKRINLRYQWGELALLPYRNFATAVAYRINQRFQTNVSYQLVDHGGTQDQFILSGSYDLGGYKAIIGRLVEQNGQLSGFISYSRSGNRGIEYYLIVGDPSSLHFRASVILKVVAPFQLKF